MSIHGHDGVVGTDAHATRFGEAMYGGLRRGGRVQYLIGVALLAVLGAAVVPFWRAPVESIASIGFRAMFDGAAEDRYPNGTSFSASDVIATSVRHEVFAKHDLKRFGTIDEFSAAVFVLGSNGGLNSLVNSYLGMLANPRVTPVDRARLEDEFERKRAALVDPVYSVNLRLTGWIAELPPNVQRSVLEDLLAVWARQTLERKGGMTYDVPVVSSHILFKEVVEREDYLVAIDILRAKLDRAFAAVAAIEELPGAHRARTPEGMSLAETRAALEDVVRFRLEPLLDLIRNEGMTRNAMSLTLYVNNQLSQLGLERQRLQRLIGTLEEVVAGYAGAAGTDTTSDTPAPRPAIDSSFFDRLLTLSAAKADQTYRRTLTNRIIKESERVADIEREIAYYRDIASRRATATRPGDEALIRGRITIAFDEAAKHLDVLSALYAQISAQNLNPSGKLYAVTAPFSQRVIRSLDTRRVALAYGVVFVFVVMALAGVTRLAKVVSRTGQPKVPAGPRWVSPGV